MIFPAGDFISVCNNFTGNFEKGDDKSMVVIVGVVVLGFVSVVLQVSF